MPVWTPIGIAKAFPLASRCASPKKCHFRLVGPGNHRRIVPRPAPVPGGGRPSTNCLFSRTGSVALRPVRPGGCVRSEKSWRVGRSRWRCRRLPGLKALFRPDALPGQALSYSVEARVVYTRTAPDTGNRSSPAIGERIRGQPHSGSPKMGNERNRQILSYLSPNGNLT